MFILYLFDTSEVGNRRRFRTQVVNSRNFAKVTIIDSVDELLNESRVDITKDIFDRLIFDLCVLNGDRALKNTDALRILIEDCFDVFSSPEGILRRHDEKKIQNITGDNIPS